MLETGRCKWDQIHPSLPLPPPKKNNIWFFSSHRKKKKSSYHFWHPRFFSYRASVTNLGRLQSFFESGQKYNFVPEPGLRSFVNQAIIRVRERIPHIARIPWYPSSSANVTSALRGCFCGGFVFVSSLFFQDEGKPPTLCKQVNSLYLNTWGCLLWYFNYKWRNFGSRFFLNTEQLNGRQRNKWSKRQSKQTHELNATEQTNGRLSADRSSPPKQQKAI